MQRNNNLLISEMFSGTNMTKLSEFNLPLVNLKQFERIFFKCHKEKADFYVDFSLIKSIHGKVEFYFLS